MHIAMIQMRNLQRGAWVTARDHRVAETDYGRITDVDLKAKTIKVMWLSTATENTHSIVLDKSGDHRTQTLALSSEEDVMGFVRGKTAEADERLVRAHRNLTQAEDAKNDLIDRITKIFG